jgi:hypothetical protein
MRCLLSCVKKLQYRYFDNHVLPLVTVEVYSPNKRRLLQLLDTTPSAQLHNIHPNLSREDLMLKPFCFSYLIRLGNHFASSCICTTLLSGWIVDWNRGLSRREVDQQLLTYQLSLIGCILSQHSYQDGMSILGS